MLGYPTSTSLSRVDGLLTDPRVLGCHNNSPRNSFTVYLIKVSTPSNTLLSKATLVLFVITLKLRADNPSHYFLTNYVNVPIIIWVLVLLS